MKEDELYRTSTQYRLWSFTPETLVSLRTSTNAIAAKRVRAAIKRAREEASSKANNDSNNNGTGREEKEKEIDCLTVEEEQKLVRFYCVKAMELADFCSFPTNVKVCTYNPMLYHHYSSSRLYVWMLTKDKQFYERTKNRRRQFNTCGDSTYPTVR